MNCKKVPGLITAMVWQCRIQRGEGGGWK